jgi:parvulin-like peptidyl-prolyl isomerase
MDNLPLEEISRFDKKISSTSRKLKVLGLLLIAIWMFRFSYNISRERGGGSSKSIVVLAENRQLKMKIDSLNRISNRQPDSLSRTARQLKMKIDSLNRISEELISENQQLRVTVMGLQNAVNVLEAAQAPPKGGNSKQ